MFDSLADSVTHTLTSLPLTPVMWLLAGVSSALLLFILGWAIRGRISQQQKNTLIEIIQASEQRLSVLKTRLSNQRAALNETQLSGFNETLTPGFSDDLTDALADQTIIGDLTDTTDRTQHTNTQSARNIHKNSHNSNSLTRLAETRNHTNDAAKDTPKQNTSNGHTPGLQSRVLSDQEPPDDGIPVVGVKHDTVQVIRKSYEETRRRHTEELITFRESLKKLKQQYNTKLEDQARALAFQEREAAAKIETLNHSLAMNKHKIVGLIAEVERHKSTIEDLTKVPASIQAPALNLADTTESDLHRQIDVLSSDNQGYQLEITRLKSELRSTQLQRDQLAATSATQPAPLPLSAAPSPSSLAPNRQSANSGDTSDNLQQVKGIGPVLEKALNRHGIRQFSQIAAFTDEDIDRIALLINTAAKRIRTEQWVAAAAQLHREKYHQEVT